MADTNTAAATRPGETETIVYLNHDELHPFKGHPFQVRDDDAIQVFYFGRV